MLTMGGVYNFWNVLGWRLSFRFWWLLLLLPSSSELLLSSCRWKNVIPRILYTDRCKYLKVKYKILLEIWWAAAETAPYSLSTNHPPVVLFAGSAVRCALLLHSAWDRRPPWIYYIFNSSFSLFFLFFSRWHHKRRIMKRE